MDSRMFVLLALAMAAAGHASGQSMGQPTGKAGGREKLVIDGQKENIFRQFPGAAGNAAMKNFQNDKKADGYRQVQTQDTTPDSLKDYSTYPGDTPARAARKAKESAKAAQKSADEARLSATKARRAQEKAERAAPVGASGHTRLDEDDGGTPDPCKRKDPPQSCGK